LFVVVGIAWGGFLGARHLAGVRSALDQLENLSRSCSWTSRVSPG
jgi:hypothetical protein